MKKYLIAILAALMCGVAAQAQVRFGVKAGLDINKLHFSGNNNFSSENRAGFTGGFMTEFTVPIVGLCFDASLMYTRMNGELHSHKDFMDIPINIKYKFNIPAVSSLVAPYLYTGPDFAFKLAGKDKDPYKTFQCAWNIGIGAELIRHLQIGAGYAFGINNIAKAVGVNTTGNIKTRNSYWTVTAAYLF